MAPVVTNVSFLALFIFAFCCLVALVSAKSASNSSSASSTLAVTKYRNNNTRTSKLLGSWSAPYIKYSSPLLNYHHQPAPQLNQYSPFSSHQVPSSDHLGSSYAMELNDQHDRLPSDNYAGNLTPDTENYAAILDDVVALAQQKQVQERQRFKSKPKPQAAQSRPLYQATGWVTSDGRPCIPAVFQNALYNLFGISPTTTAAPATVTAATTTTTTCASVSSTTCPTLFQSITACDNNFLLPGGPGSLIYPIGAVAMVDASKCAAAGLPADAAGGPCQIKVAPPAAQVSSAQSGTIAGGSTTANQCYFYLSVAPPYNQIRVTCRKTDGTNVDPESVTIRGGTAANTVGVNNLATPTPAATICGDPTAFCTPAAMNGAVANVYSSTKSTTSFLMFSFDSTKFTSTHSCTWNAVVA